MAPVLFCFVYLFLFRYGSTGNPTFEGPGELEIKRLPKEMHSFVFVIIVSNTANSIATASAADVTESYYW